MWPHTTVFKGEEGVRPLCSHISLLEKKNNSQNLLEGFPLHSTVQDNLCAPPTPSKETKRISSQINKIVILLARNVGEYFYINRNVFHNQLKVWISSYSRKFGFLSSKAASFMSRLRCASLILSSLPSKTLDSWLSILMYIVPVKAEGCFLPCATLRILRKILFLSP